MSEPNRARSGAVLFVAILAVALFIRWLDVPPGDAQSADGPQAVQQRTRSRPPTKPGFPPKAINNEQPSLYPAVPFVQPAPHRGTVTCAAPVHSTKMQSGLLRCGTNVTTSAMLIGDALVAEVPEGSGTGEFVFDEIVRGHIAWKDVPEGGARPCTITSIDGWATGIHGRVVGDVVPHSDVRGCRSYATIEDGKFFMTVFAPADCSLRVESWEPERKGEGAAVAVHLEVGRDLDVVLQYPTANELRPYTDEELAALNTMDERIEELDATLRRAEDGN